MVFTCNLHPYFFDLGEKRRLNLFSHSLSLLYKQNNSLLRQAECFQIRPDCECYLVALLMSTGVVGVGPNACKLHSSNDISLVKSNLFTTATTTTTIKLYSVQVFFQPLCLFSNPFWPRVQHHTHISHFWQTTTFKTVFIKMSSIAALLQAAEYIERRERGMRKKNGWEIEATALILSWFLCLAYIFWQHNSKIVNKLNRFSESTRKWFLLTVQA